MCNLYLTVSFSLRYIRIFPTNLTTNIIFLLDDQLNVYCDIIKGFEKESLKLEGKLCKFVIVMKNLFMLGMQVYFFFYFHFFLKTFFFQGRITNLSFHSFSFSLARDHLVILHETSFTSLVFCVVLKHC